VSNRLSLFVASCCCCCHMPVLRTRRGMWTGCVLRRVTCHTWSRNTTHWQSRCSVKLSDLRIHTKLILCLGLLQYTVHVIQCSAAVYTSSDAHRHNINQPLRPMWCL